MPSSFLRLLTWAAILARAPIGLSAQSGTGDSVVYILTPITRLDVKTGSTGLFRFAGHDHLIRARAFSGRVVYFPNTPSASRVEIALPTDSLMVLTPPDTAEIRKVTESMRTEVLDVALYPEIKFASTAVAPIQDGLRIQGELTMHGQTRVVTIDVRTTIGTDTLRATGTFFTKQTDFGIKPYRGGPAGIVKVANRVEFELDVVALRSTGP